MIARGSRAGIVFLPRSAQPGQDVHLGRRCSLAIDSLCTLRSYLLVLVLLSSYRPGMVPAAASIHPRALASELIAL